MSLFLLSEGNKMGNPAWQLLPSGIEPPEPEDGHVALLLSPATRAALGLPLLHQHQAKAAALLFLGLSPFIKLIKHPNFPPSRGFHPCGRSSGRCWDEFLGRVTQKKARAGRRGALITSSSVCAMGNVLLITPELADPEQTHSVWKQSLTPALNPMMCVIWGTPVGISRPLPAPSRVLWGFLG